MVFSPSLSVSSTINSAALLEKAQNLAKKLGRPFYADPFSVNSDFLLAYTTRGLELVLVNVDKKKLTPLLYVDFIGGKNGYRLVKNCTIHQPLARAVGIKRGFRPNILDATGGLGTDSFVFASLGCKTTICERHPVLAALLSDGLNRAHNHNRVGTIVQENVTFIEKDAAIYLNDNNPQINTIYLDPMYPHSESSARNKQEMRVIRDLVGDDDDADQLFAACLKSDATRIVVKRPKKAPQLGSIPPSHTIVMKSSRFDIYFQPQ